MVEIAFKILDAILPAFFNRRRLRVRVHRAVFFGTPSRTSLDAALVHPARAGTTTMDVLEWEWERGISRGSKPEEYFFVNLTNRSSTRDLEVTHMWFQTDRQIQILQPERPLPVRLKPDQSWETWLPVAALPQTFLPDALTLARARLSSGAVVTSKPNENVPDYGPVPGPNRQS
jgi:hypothetical protein